jgi:hypothetical protein
MPMKIQMNTLRDIPEVFPWGFAIQELGRQRLADGLRGDRPKHR